MLLLFFAGSGYLNNGSIRRPQWAPAMSNPAKPPREAFDEDEDEFLSAVGALMSISERIGSEKPRV